MPPQKPRATTRHDVILTATLIVEGQESQEEIHNLALGGAYVTAPRRLPMGHRVELRFQVPPSGDEITISGQVRWADDSGAGVQFDGLRAREVWSLNKYFESLG